MKLIDDLEVTELLHRGGVYVSLELLMYVFRFPRPVFRGRWNEAAVIGWLGGLDARDARREAIKD
ncbi:hypothetical protein [Azotobacter chroococcum]|uniref:hypothetical protein n=1 Tax=Azotobacter chroococcum TaxID=353 RepID=UPI0010AEB9D9|nr:hypothetical protein [Azotobacter chroococcum]TKD39924.1 hypothetical protein FCG41_11870 [Azotobacter chroococcum]